MDMSGFRMVDDNADVEWHSKIRHKKPDKMVPFQMVNLYHLMMEHKNVFFSNIRFSDLMYISEFQLLNLLLGNMLFFLCTRCFTSIKNKRESNEGERERREYQRQRRAL